MSRFSGLQHFLSEIATAMLFQDFPSLFMAAEKLNETFQSNFSSAPDWSSINLWIDQLQETNKCWDPLVTVSAVHKELELLNLKKAPGSDGISPRLLFAGRDVLAPVLAHLISLSIEKRQIPKLWKSANIVPVPKKRNPTMKDIRPISLLPIVGKICEKLVLSSVKEQLIESYGNEQFGFRPKSSTTLSHISIHNFITENLDKSTVNGVLLISLDMSRAFDSLSHEALMKTICSTDLPKGFIQWCANYLQNRQQKVIIEQVSSNSIEVSSGVPQGSTLAPFLFCVQI